MGDRFYGDSADRSSYSIQRNEDYYDEEDEDDDDEMEGRYGGLEVNDVGFHGKPEELACPFCLEDFDVLGLCCHIDADHRMEVKPGICPVCTTKVGVNMASHLITQHETILKTLCNKKHRGTRPRSSTFALRKEMQEKHLRCIKESPCAGAGGPSSDFAVDSTLLSFVKNSQPAGRTQIIGEASSKSDDSLGPANSSTDDYLESKAPSLSTDMDNERARRCDFLQSLMLSTILDDL